MTVLGDTLHGLEEIVGPGNLLSATDAVVTYRVDGQQPVAVALPESPVQVAGLLRRAADGGLSVLVRGGGRHMHLGAPPGPVGLVVSTKGLSDVVEYDAENLTITAQAGITLGQVQRVVGERGQMLPLDPPGGDMATLGGTAATNLAGPIRMRYGSPRDLVIGLRVALAEGTLIKTGGKTVKNVAGYELTKLFVGSFGTLGAICEVTVRLTPMPDARALLIMSVPARDVKDVTLKLLTSRLEVASLDIANEEAVRRMKLSLPVTPTAETRVVFVGLMGDLASIRRQEGEIRSLSAGACARLDHADAEAVWQALRDAPHPRDKLAVVARASLPVSAAAEAVDLAAHLQGWWAVARGGDGVVHLGPPGDREPDVVRAELIRLREFAQQRGGAVVLEAGPLEMKRSFTVWGNIPNLDLMWRLKEAYDPTGNLGCGRYLSPPQKVGGTSRGEGG